MIAVIALMIITWFPIARFFYHYGKKSEQIDRLTRLNALRRLLNTRE
jgi:hypothetical protein